MYFKKSIMSTFKNWTILLVIISMFASSLNAQVNHSIAKKWNELLLQSIRGDLARPTVHARNLFHTSAAMYDAWAVFDQNARPYYLGNTINGFTFNFNGFTPGPNIEAQRTEAISYAMYRLLLFRFRASPGLPQNRILYNNLMAENGYDINFTSTDYSTGSAAALGNYIADLIINFGLQDGSRENATVPYSNGYYTPTNPPLNIFVYGNSTALKPDRWQPLQFSVFIDQNGNVVGGNTPPFLSAEWGNVVPFSLTDSDKVVFTRNGRNYNVFLDPGPPIMLDTTSVANSQLFKRTHSLVLQWSSHLDRNDGVMVDISPASLGNVTSIPNTIADYENFYDYDNGGDNGTGYSVNPITGQPYTPQIVPRGDYTRVLAEFWADGPSSETPPGHWFSIVNYISDHPMFVKKFRGQGPVLNDLEWDVKTYFMLGGAMHDAAISTWSIKGWHDNARPVTALRYMAMKGQCTDPNITSYHPAGLELKPGFVELILPGDPLAGPNNENVNKIKVKAWKAHSNIPNPATDEAKVGWILGGQWWPYQRQTFVTPPFAGYISGHSTFSRTAAELLTELTGSPYFPGGMGEFIAKKDEYLVFENGPSQDIKLQWATYRDASDQCSLSRIWGGIHPPMDDIPGRKNGIVLAEKAFNKAISYFFSDNDEDGFTDELDCDDTNANVNPNATEVCDFIDNNCDGIIDGSSDFDSDGLTDNCDSDDDNDSVSDTNDQCPTSQLNASVNLFGCTDEDGDGFFPDYNSTLNLYDPDDSDECSPNNQKDNCDIDDDGLTNLEERTGKDGILDSGDETDPSNPDTDDDGFTDGFEVAILLTDPNDECSPFRPNAGCGGTISGIVFLDANYDGIYNNNETKLSNISVVLFRKKLPWGTENMGTVTTDGNGKYLFGSLEDGDYFVQFKVSSDYGFTKYNIGSDITDSDVGGSNKENATAYYNINDQPEVLQNLNAGLYECNFVGDMVWYDFDKNDILEYFENGINGIKVELYRLEGGSYMLFDEKYTGNKPGTPSDDGYFNFCAPNGTYYIKVVMPPRGLVRARPNIGGNKETDSDLTNGNGPATTSSFSIFNNDRSDLDAGFYPMAEAGNLVWFDSNSNGIHDQEESGLTNVLVQAYDISSNLIAETYTDENGHYNIDYLEKQKYYLKFTPAIGLQATFHHHKQDDDNDSDIYHYFGQNTTDLIAFGPGQKKTHIDAGFSYASLPLIWANIEAEHKETYNYLHWSTESEINVDLFEIYKSQNGIDYFKIDQIKADNKITGSNYQLLDYRIEGSHSYYKIKQIDFDGRYTFSEIVKAEHPGKDSDIVIYPNPSKNYFIIKAQNFEDKLIAEIYALDGRLVLTKEFNGHIEVSNLEHGLYTAKIISKHKTYIKEIVIIE